MKKTAHSAFYRAIRLVQAGVVLLTVVLLGFVARIQLIAGESILDRPFVDAVTIDRIGRLVSSGVIGIDGSDRVTLDSEALERMIGSSDVRRRIRRLIPHMAVRQGRPYLPETAVAVHYPGNLKKQLRRGAILDRNQAVLASGPAQARAYPLGAAGYPVTGVTHPVYRTTGMEQTLDSLLAGDQRVGFKARLKEFIYGSGTLPPDVILTVDSELQRMLYGAMSGYTGSVVVLDIKTGDILAAVSCPSFDPSDRSGANWERIHDVNLTHNRCWNRRYPPGSTFKIVNAAALLESDVVEHNFRYICQGRHSETKVDEHAGHAHGIMNVDAAIRASCNVFFCETAIRLQSELKTTAEKFGFNRVLPLLPPALEDRLPEPDRLPSSVYELDELVTSRNPDTGRIFLRSRYSAYSSRDYRRNLGTTGRTGFGQGTVEATPLQMALVASVIANRGVLQEPRLVAGIRSAPGDAGVKWLRPHPDRRIVSNKSADRIAKAMESVMTGGTGAAIPRLYRHPTDGLILRQWVPWDQCIHVAGKTGTAEVAGKPDHSWFISFGPVEDPRYAVAVLCEHAGFGSTHAGPVAMKVYEYLFKRDEGGRDE